MSVSNKKNQFWRNEQGKAQCAGDMCPVDCDAKCPLWLSTIALEKLQAGNLKESIDYFKKSLAVDPDIPETHNNMAMAYGFSDNHSEAYNHFKKALDLRPDYVKALSGIIVAEKNLGMYADALVHCDQYKALTGDNMDTMRSQIARLQGGSTISPEEAPQSEDNENASPEELGAELISESDYGSWELYRVGDHYQIWDCDEEEWARTPGGTLLTTSYEELAERILEDIDSFGPDYMGGDSVLPWHYTMVERFSKMDHAAVEKLLDDCFLKKTDWSLDANVSSESLRELFGMRPNKKKQIRDWLSSCTIMQMNAACCIGNSFHSLNMAYVLADYLEKYTGEELDEKMGVLADHIAAFTNDVPFEVMAILATFKLYYGIHLKENGPIINI